MPIPWLVAHMSALNTSLRINLEGKYHTMSPSLNIQSTAGHHLTLVPVPMRFLPRSDPQAWKSFVTDRTEWNVDPGALDQLQSFMDANDTDAVTDGRHCYTVNAGLSHCEPERISDSVVFELRIDGEPILSGNGAIRVIYHNLTGRNFEKPVATLQYTHAGYLAMMEREFSFKAAGAVLTYHVAGNDTALFTHTFSVPETTHE